MARQGAAAFRVARWPRAGGVGWNTASCNVEAPIRGVRKSGVGRGVSSYALHAYGELQPMAWAGMSAQAWRGAGDVKEACVAEDM